MPRTYCAYNQTRECFISLHVAVADLSYAMVRDMFLSLTLQPDEALWVTPFRGLPHVSVRTPFDLLFLDEEGLVLDLVESFPTVTPIVSSLPVSSMVVLPSHSVYSTQTRIGDQMVLCRAAEMQQYFEDTTAPQDGKKEPPVIEARRYERVEWVNAAQLDAAKYVAGLRFREFRQPALEGRPYLMLEEQGGRPITPIVLVDAPRNEPEPEPEYQEEDQEPEKKNWWQRLVAKTDNREDRYRSDGIVAYYWTGSAPASRKVRNLNKAGFYLLTEERWYPGTMMTMTLQRTDLPEDVPERSIAVQASTVWWGEDGLGMKFYYYDPKDGPKFQTAQRVASAKDVDRFLQKLRH